LTGRRRDYLYLGDFADERAQLDGIRALWDPGSRTLLEEVGLKAGWRCLEVGAGGGSLIEWMVGRGAAVTAADIDTRFVTHHLSADVNVSCLNIVTDQLPAGELDLVHARLGLEHLGDRRAILDRLASTLRPGGWIVIEDYKLTCLSLSDQSYLEASVRAIVGFMEQAGFDVSYVRTLLSDLADAGFTDIRGEGRARIVDAGPPGFDFFKLSFESIPDTAAQAGALSEADADADATAARFADQSMRIFTPMRLTGAQALVGMAAIACRI
jgi:SAM-dependent methyltransferase